MTEAELDRVREIIKEIKRRTFRIGELELELKRIRASRKEIQ